MSDRTERLRVKAKAAQERLKQAEARDREKERKILTRKKILLGGVIMADIKEGVRSWDSYKQSLNKRLTRANDRKLFDLDEKEDSTV